MLLMSATLPLHVLNDIAALLGIAYAPDLLLLAAVLFLVVLVFHLSLSLTELREKHRVLVQEFGVLTARAGENRPLTSDGDIEPPDTTR
jgi:hypothetical protein